MKQIIFGDTEITTGAGNDLQQVTNLARPYGYTIWYVKNWPYSVRR